jgi:hypothetical protein
VMIKGVKVCSLIVILMFVGAMFGTFSGITAAHAQSYEITQYGRPQKIEVASPTPTPLVVERPFFSQRDPNWQNDPMIDEDGQNCGTIWEYGCAMTSIAMVLKYYGVDTDPGKLNAWLNENNGYASGGYLYWDKPAEYSNEKVE